MGFFSLTVLWSSVHTRSHIHTHTSLQKNNNWCFITMLTFSNRIVLHYSWKALSLVSLSPINSLRYFPRVGLGKKKSALRLSCPWAWALCKWCRNNNFTHPVGLNAAVDDAVLIPLNTGWELEGSMQSECLGMCSTCLSLWAPVLAFAWHSCTCLQEQTPGRAAALQFYSSGWVVVMDTALSFETLWV